MRYVGREFHDLEHLRVQRRGICVIKDAIVVVVNIDVVDDRIAIAVGTGVVVMIEEVRDAIAIAVLCKVGHTVTIKIEQAGNALVARIAEPTFDVVGIPLPSRSVSSSRVKPAIEAARLAGEFVILLSHHPSEDFDLPFPARKLSAKDFRSYLAAQPHIIAHLAGHTHYNQINQINGPNPYLEVITCAIIDYPQEGRLLDLYYDAPTETITLASTMFSHHDTPTRLSAESYRRATIDAQQGQAFEDVEKAHYQSLFQDATKSWGINAIPQENLRHTPTKRLGTPTDRTKTYRLRHKRININ